jgi:hypothetical protein
VNRFPSWSDSTPGVRRCLKNGFFCYNGSGLGRLAELVSPQGNSVITV